LHLQLKKRISQLHETKSAMKPSKPTLSSSTSSKRVLAGSGNQSVPKASQAAMKSETQGRSPTSSSGSVPASPGLSPKVENLSQNSVKSSQKASLQLGASIFSQKPGPLLAASLRKAAISVGTKSKSHSSGKKALAAAKTKKLLGISTQKSSKVKMKLLSAAGAAASDESHGENVLQDQGASFGKRHFLHIEKEEEYTMKDLPKKRNGESYWLNEETMMPRQQAAMDYSKYEPDIGARMCLSVAAYEEFQVM
jgi:hypothetical protein